MSRMVVVERGNGRPAPRRDELRESPSCFSPPRFSHPPRDVSKGWSRGGNGFGLAELVPPTELVRIFAGVLLLLSVTAPAAFAAGAPLDFNVGILPVLTKAGCNAGACHGAATGQGGFKLSLLGYAPDLDHASITRELGARRIDLSHPGDSLLLRKATRQIDHEGDRRFRADSPEALLLRDWISRGAPRGRSDLVVTGLVVHPGILGPVASTEPQAITVTAQLSDGSTMPATDLALYTSNDDRIADVDRRGRVRLHGPGTTAIMIRFGGAVGSVRVGYPFPGQPDETAFAGFKPRNFIDDALLRRLGEMNVPPSPEASGTEFLRRVHLDLTGRLPAPERIAAFAAGGDGPDQRDAVIDRLLAGPEFTDLWTQRLADLLLLSGKRGSEKASRTYHQWLHAQVATNAPWDRMARELLTAEGPVDEVGPASFALLANDPRDFAEQVGSIFLAARIGCARCHAHPADRWTRTDYHQFAAFFARIRRDGGRIDTAPQGEVEDPQTGRPLPPRPLGERIALDPAADRRGALAEWVVSADNPLFARAFVNRVWKHLMGRGLVEPVDDLRPTNPAVHPELLDALAHDFASSGFDLRHLVGSIARSAAYQRSARPLPGNATDDRLHSHALLKMPDGRVLLDMIAQATGVPEEFPDQPEVERAVQLVGAQSPSAALDILGRCSRETTCESSSIAGGGLAQALHLVNGATINRRLGQGHLARWLSEKPSNDELITRLYLHTLSRPPLAAERDEWRARLAAGEARSAIAEDLLWALLNSREFTFNH